METSKSNDSDAFAAALRILTRRDRSEVELRKKLEQSGFSVSAIDQAIEKCRSYKYLDDQHYARERAKALFRSGRGVGRKVLLDLRRQGIADEIAQSAVIEASQEFPNSQLLQDQLDRRFPGFDFAQADEREKHRVISFFQRRGFPLNEIFSVLRKPD
ncbi:regulatory protein RecX [Malonomonas rubra]|uniref:regulatory protein RecX n=1 Tax=Malonomonas rubra TaxID=57040 RepID=UPI0026EC187A|nr:regulatory protein RecX [Malonomonas rubra]